MRNPETVLFFIVLALIIISLFIYFLRRTNRRILRRRKKKEEQSSDIITKIKEELYTEIMENDIVEEWAEQLRILEAQLDLVGELSPVFTVCCDYSREDFSINAGGMELLGFGEDDEIDELTFRSLIHPDDVTLYDEITDCKDIRKQIIAQSPYFLRLKSQKKDVEYERYLVKVKPLFNDAEESIALIMAFLNAGFIIGK